ncbi:MAG: adenosine kinase [Treponema sp.]|nr:adenosine kinase [Treponema sp.]
METPELLCIGNAMVDIFAEANDAFLDFAGLTGRVQHISGKKMNALLEALEKDGSLKRTAGGGAANLAKIAGFLGLSSVFTGSSGIEAKDPYAALFAEELRAAGLVLKLKEIEESQGRCLVVKTPGGETHIAASPGASLAFDAADLDENLFAAVSVVALDGYMLGRDALVRRVMALARRRSKTLALDLGAPFQARSFGEEIRSFCAEQPLILFMNEEEATAFAGSPEEAARAAGRDTVTVVKRAERGALVFYRDEKIDVPAETAAVSDPTGAGDAFAAAFLAAFIRGRGLEECAALGNRCAGRIIGIPGTNISAGKLADLKEELFRQ